MQTMVSDPVQWLTQLLALMGYSTQVTLTPKNDGGNINHWLEIDTTGWRSDQIQNPIGHEGAVIDAIQYLANTILNVRNTEENYQFFTVEIAGYRARRMAQIAKIAQEAADWVRTKKRAYKIEHLTPAERRQVHLLLQAHPDLKTESVGKEPHRCLIVKPANS
jgi:spoIIIJ-associated protein